MSKMRGFYYFTAGASPSFILATKVAKFAEGLGELLEYDKEAFIDGLCEAVANYDIDQVYIWVQVTVGPQTAIKWGSAPVIQSETLGPEAIRAAYYVWSQASCTPEEAAKALNISMPELMDLTDKFEKMYT